MKKRIFKTAAIGSALMVGIPLLSLIFIGTGPESFTIGEVIGYSTIFIAMALIFFAIRSFRDDENGGLLSFGEGMKIGTAIAALGGLAFGLYNLLYVLVIDPDFTEKYLAYTSGLETGSPEVAAKVVEMKEAYGFWMTVEGQTVTMFMTVFLIGFIITVISSIILQNKKVQNLETNLA
ncbi:MAG: DUF4199 domain-containing protein [Bacteroidota bacterium]